MNSITKTFAVATLVLAISAGLAAVTVSSAEAGPKVPGTKSVTASSLGSGR